MTTNPPHARRLTAAEFTRMADAGAFGAARVELIGGEVVPVAAQSNWHSFIVEAARRALEQVFPDRDFWVRAQFSLNLDPHSVVDPDLAVTAGGYLSKARKKAPKTALLVVEVSETTVADDRRVKGSLYAAAGVPEYWVVDVTRRQVEVRRDPPADPAAEFGAGYRTVAYYAAGDTVVPLASPTGSGVDIGQILAVEDGDEEYDA